MPTHSNDYWFPAKRYGWGWGLPSRWQGWVVIAIYAVLLAAGIVVLRPHAQPMERERNWHQRRRGCGMVARLR